VDGSRERCSLITGSLRMLQKAFMKYRAVRPLWRRWNRLSRARSNWTFIYTRSSRRKVGAPLNNWMTGFTGIPSGVNVIMWRCSDFEEDNMRTNAN
jgi:hypothetical protein